MALIRTAISESFAVEFGRYGVADNNLIVWLNQELAACDIAAKAVPLSPKPAAKNRVLALRLALAAQTLGDAFGTAEERWFHMTQLLDLSCRDLDDLAEHVLARAAAVWLVSAKFCCKVGPSAVSEQLVEQLVDCASAISRSEGGDVVQAADVAGEELCMAQALNFNVSSPTVHVWLRAFNMRLGLVTKGALAGVLDAAHALQELLLHQLVWSSRVRPDQAPHPTAVGVLALTVAVVYPPMADRLCPPDVAPKQWEQTLASVLVAGLAELNGQDAVPAQALIKLDPKLPQLDKVICAALEFATLSEVSSIRSTAWHVLEVLRAVLAPRLRPVALPEPEGEPEL